MQQPTTMSLDNTNAYYPRTLTVNNGVRYTILPVFHPSSPLASTTIEELRPPLLLCNVPGRTEQKLSHYYLLIIIYFSTEEDLSQLQLARRESDAYSSSVQLIESNLKLIDQETNACTISTYQQWLYDLSMKWKISIQVLDYNLARLEQCTTKCLEQLKREEQFQLFPPLPTTATFSLEELSVALEFYLQVDSESLLFFSFSYVFISVAYS